MKAISVSLTPVLQFVFPEDKTPYVQEHMHKETTVQLKPIWQELGNSNSMVFSTGFDLLKLERKTDTILYLFCWNCLPLY